MDKSVLNSLLEMDKEDMLKALYEYRENKDGIVTEKFLEESKNEQDKTNVAYLKFKDKLKSYINDDKKISDIMNAFELYKDAYNNEHGLYYKQYYKIGIEDAMKLILQCLA